HGNADRLDLANLAAPGLEDVDRRQVERLNVERPAPLSRHTESDRLRRECEGNGKDRSGFDRSSHRCLRCNVLAPPVERQDLLLVPREPARNGASGAASWRKRAIASSVRATSRRAAGSAPRAARVPLA